MCWVRLKGPTCHLFIISVHLHLPHRGRVIPSQDDALADLEKVLKIVPQGDCICALGDFNEQLEASIPNRTGKWTADPKSSNSDKIMHIMQMHELTAANTLFEPKYKRSLETFLQTKRNDAVDGQGGLDQGEHVGAKVKVRYKGTQVVGTVTTTYEKKGRNDGQYASPTATSNTMHAKPSRKF